MDIMERLDEIWNSLLPNQKKERHIVYQLSLLVNLDSKELPREFIITSTMKTKQFKTFLKEELKLNVKDVIFLPYLTVIGSPRFHVKLN